MLQLCLILGGFTLFSFLVIVFSKEPRKENNLSQIAICDNANFDDFDHLELLENMNYQGWN